MEPEEPEEQGWGQGEGCSKVTWVQLVGGLGF